MIKAKQINEAATAHAKEQLGTTQFKSNKEAVKAITDDFKSGVKWLQTLQKKTANE